MIRMMGHGSSTMVRRVYAQLSDQTFQDVIGRLPSVGTHTGHANVIPIGKAEQNGTALGKTDAKNA
jgi:hypothetical protein